MKWATFTGAFPGVDVTVGHYRPRGLVSWTWAIDPYTFYVPQITIAAKREPFEIDQFGRVETLLTLTLTFNQFVPRYYTAVVQEFYLLEGDECDDGCADGRAGAARTC